MQISEYFVLQSPSVHITNLDKLKEVDRESAVKVKVAEELIRENKSLKKVILMDCLPRLDHGNCDLSELKPEMAGSATI